MVVPQVERYREPEAGEVRQAGWAYLSGPSGVVFRKVHSCERCADTAGFVWVPGLFESVCDGCEVSLSGLVE